MQPSESVAVNVGLGDLGGGMSPAPAGDIPLPCLSSNNSDNNEGIGCRKLTAYEKKRAHATRTNIENFVTVKGLNNVGFLTLTPPERVDYKEFQRRFNNAARRILGDLFVDYIAVLEFMKSGLPHFHLLVDCGEDIRTGFNWEHYEASRKWWKSGRKGPQPQGSLNRTERLTWLHEQLRARLSGYGLGRSELVPVRKVEAIGFYIGGYLNKGIGNRTLEQKGARFVRYSQTCPRIVKGAFSWLGMHSWLWRAKLRAWANSHNCQNMQEVAAVFGPRWAYFHREAILGTELEFYPTAQHAEADGHKFSPEIRSEIDMTGPCSFGKISNINILHLRRAMEVDEINRTLEACSVGGVASSPLSVAWLGTYRRLYGETELQKFIEEEERSLVREISTVTEARKYTLKRSTFPPLLSQRHLF